MPDHSQSHQSSTLVAYEPPQVENPAPQPTENPPERPRRLIDRLPMSVLWALIGQGVFSVMRLLTSVTIGGRFGSGSEEQLGYYSLAFSVLLILVALHEAFVTTPLTVFNQNKTDNERKSFSGNMLLMSFLVIGLIAAGIGLLVGLNWGFEVLKPELAAALIVATVLAPLQLVREFSRRWLLANLQVKASALLECFYAGVYLLTLLSLIFAARVSAISVFTAIGCVNLIGLAVWWWIYRREFDFSGEKKAQISENFRYGQWVAGENVCSTITMYACAWILTFAIDEAAGGVFFACFTVVLLANPFLLGVTSILSPRAAQEYVADGWRGLRRVLFNYGCFVVGVLALFALGLAIVGQPVTNLFFKYQDYFDAHYDGVNRVTMILGLAMPLMAISFVVTTGLWAIQRPRDSFYAALVGLVTLIVTNFAFAKITLETAAISFVISIAAGAVVRSAFLLRAYREAGSSFDNPMMHQ